MKRSAIALVLILVSNPGRADFLNGNRLHDMCVDPARRSGTTLYAAGVIGGMEMMKHIAFCIPDGVNLGQIGDLVCKDLADYPQARHALGVTLVVSTLARAWPCPKP